MFTLNPNFQRYLFLYFSLGFLVSCGGGGGGGSQAPAPDSSANTAPTISTLVTSYSVTENTTSVTTISASDAQGDSLSFSLTGNDASLFSISNAGAVAFSSSPDYENPSDTNNDNVYEINVVVSDGTLSSSLGLVITVNNDTSDDVTPGPTLLGTKVIDGYISGANVFIDFNWNLLQDDGEPSATEDEVNSIYNFEEIDFASIDNFTVECAKLRPRVAEIPAGAVDADQGVVDSPYNLYFFPWYGNNNEETDSANVTPLTSLFTSYITNELDNASQANISVANGCASAANDIGVAIENRVEEVMSGLTQFGIDPNTFYDDFIATSNETLQEFGQVVANYLQLTYGVSLVLEEAYEVKMRTQIDQLLLESLLADTIPAVFEFALFSETPEVDIGSNWTEATLYAVYDIFGNQNGELLSSANDDAVVYAPTLENLRTYTDFVARERQFYAGLRDPLFDDVKVLLESGTSKAWGAYRFIDMGDFNSDGCTVRYMELDNAGTDPLQKRYEITICNGPDPSDGTSKLTLSINNPDNPELVDLDNIFTQRGTQSIKDVYDGVTALSRFVDNASDNDNLLTNGDFITISIEGWQYRRTRENDAISETCYDLVNNTTTTGNEALTICSQNMPTSS